MSQKIIEEDENGVDYAAGTLWTSRKAHEWR